MRLIAARTSTQTIAYSRQMNMWLFRALFKICSHAFILPIGEVTPSQKAFTYWKYM